MPVSEFDEFNDHNVFFANYEPEYDANQPSMGERPNKKIKVTVRLNLIDNRVPDGLKTELKTNNLGLTPSSDPGKVIISGIPPNNSFGREQILEVVRKHAPNAVWA